MAVDQRVVQSNLIVLTSALKYRKPSAQSRKSGASSRERERTAERITHEQRIIDRAIEYERLRVANVDLATLALTDPAAAAQVAGRVCRHCGQSDIVVGVQEYELPWGVRQHIVWQEHRCSMLDAEYRAAEERRINAAWASKMRDAGLVGWLAGAEFDGFIGGNGGGGCLDTVLGFVEQIMSGNVGDKPWLILAGTIGLGKTHLAAAAVRRCLGAGRGAKFIVWQEYLKRLTATWDRRDDDREIEDDVLSVLERTYLVAIDDLDREPLNNLTGGVIDRALNARYNSRFPTIFTMNILPNDPDPDHHGRVLLQRYVTARTLDRIMEMTQAVVTFSGPSHRSGVTYR